MAWPTTTVSTANLDLGTDSPATARADLLGLATRVNDMIGSRPKMDLFPGLGYTSIDLTAVTVNTWTSVGPTGSGATIIWAALDNIPTDSTSIVVHCRIQGTDYAKVRVRKNGSTNAKTIFHYLTTGALSKELMSGSIFIPVSSRRFDINIDHGTFVGGFFALNLHGSVNNGGTIGGSPPPTPPPANAWDPITQTGKLAGTPINWTTTKAAASGPTVYVDDTAELNAAMATAGPGTVILLRGAGGPWIGQWNISASGSVSQPIIIVAEVPGTWASRTVIKTADKINVTGSNLIIGGFKYTWATSPASRSFVISGQNVRVTDTEYANFPFSSGSAACVVINSTAHNCRMDHNDFNAIGGMTLQYDPTYPNFAAASIIEYNNYTGTTNKWLQIGQLPNPYQTGGNERLLNTGVITRYNKVINCESHEIKTSGNFTYRNYLEGCDDAIGQRAGFGNVYEGNYFKLCDYGIRCSDVDNTLVNNVFDTCNNAITLKEGSLLADMTPGTTYVFNSQHMRCENYLIAHNTFVNSVLRDIYLGYAQTGRNGAGHPEPYSPKNIWIYNNIAVGSAGVRVFFRLPNSVKHNDDAYSTTVDSYLKYVNVEIKNNTFYVTGTGVIGDDTLDGGTPSGYVNWNNATYTTGSVISGNGETNPLLTATYRLQAGSPAINGGIDFTKNDWSPSTKVDWDNDTRLQGAAPDRGVEEFA